MTDLPRPPTPDDPEHANLAADPHAWLEAVEAETALEWVREHNTRSLAELEADAAYEALRERLLEIYDSKARIPFVSARHGWLYNFWVDERNPRGLWRRTRLEEYLAQSPTWEILLDVDALGQAEGESWVWKGAELFPPRDDRALVSLSRGGSDAHVVREFDLPSRQFVRDGFSLPEAKSVTAWKDLDTLYVGTEFGPGSLTDSGYPRLAKEWKRGTPLDAADLVYEGRASDLAVRAVRDFERGRILDWVGRSPSFFTNETYLRRGADLVKLDKPDDATVSSWDDQLLVRLRSDWTMGDRTWPAGALLVIPLARFLAGDRDFAMLFAPTPATSLAAFTGTRSAILVVELEDVKHRVYEHLRTPEGWQRRAVSVPDVGSIQVMAYDEEENDDYWFVETGFTTPTSLHLGRVGEPGRHLIKQNPEFFASRGIVSTQHFAVSKDGTRIPYFQIAREDLPLDGSHPTILRGYGGFEISLTPGYDATAGAAWLERGGVVAVANIRGGGEYGPGWHQAALGPHRQRAYDDFAAVAEDLIRRRVTTPERLGAKGGSNGGLLMGVMLTQFPDLFRALVCEVPLLDMRRYHRLLAGASWMEEYGDPDDPEDWAYLARYSPYHNVNADRRYPRVLFMTSTRDDRVHPGHARKMVALMEAQGHDVLYYENIEGGHGGAADNRQAARMQALAFTFFARELGLRG